MWSPIFVPKYPSKMQKLRVTNPDFHTFWPIISKGIKGDPINSLISWLLIRYIYFEVMLVMFWYNFVRKWTLLTVYSKLNSALLHKLNFMIMWLPFFHNSLCQRQNIVYNGFLYIRPLQISKSTFSLMIFWSKWSKKCPYIN